MNGIDRIVAERKRQLNKEGRGAAEHDDKCLDGQLADAASCYAATYPIQRYDRSDPWPLRWVPAPIFRSAPTKARIQQLSLAGALIAAEIDRLQRLGKRLLRLSRNNKR
jgi:hypothetical protein